MYYKKQSLRDEIPEEIHDFGGKVAKSLIKDYKRDRKNKRSSFEFEEYFFKSKKQKRLY